MNAPASARVIDVTPRPVQPSGMTVTELYYTVFRHLRLILVCTGLGVLVAGTIYFILPADYVSEAKLMVRYIREDRAPKAVDADAQVRSPDIRGETIINAELEILTSLDLARQAAEVVGPDRILGSGTTNTPGASLRAAASIVRALTVQPVKNSNVIRVQFAHPKPDVVQAVLRQLLEDYKRKHVEIHQPAGLLDDFLAQQTDQLRLRLAQTEEELRRIRTNVGLVSVGDTRKAYASEVSLIRQQIVGAEAELAERRATLEELDRLNPAKAAQNPTNTVDTDNVTYHQTLVSELKILRARELDMLGRFTGSHPSVQQVQRQIADTQKLKQKLESDHPGLARMNLLATDRDRLESDSVTEATRVSALSAKIKALNTWLERVQAEALRAEDAEASMAQIARRKEIEEANFKAFSTSLEQVRLSEALGPGRVSNLNVFQEASAPALDTRSKRKPAALALFGGLAFGLALAFFIDLVLDRSLRRPAEIESRLQIPLFITIPHLDLTPPPPLLPAPQATPAPQTAPTPDQTAPTADPAEPAAAVPDATPGEPQVPLTSAGPTANASGNGRIPKVLPARGAASEPGAAPESDPPGERPGNGHFHARAWLERHLRPALRSWSARPEGELEAYHESLRDRLILHFERRGVTHKPKLVGITGCSPGCGVSSIATGLAASLSETGDGNVLLVDMNARHGARIHPFYQGRLGYGLDSALEPTAREGAQVQDNLYVVTAQESVNGRVGLVPRKFASLVPRLKASDYDYIIFDMPAVTQTSPTAKLAGLLDMVFVVVDSERTQTQVADGAARLLRDSGANVAGILNNYRPYVPRTLVQEL